MKRTKLGAIGVLIVVVSALAACTDGISPGIATAGGTPTESASAGQADPDSQAQELRFVACMRQQGIADMPDPVPGDFSGRSSVLYAIDVMGKGSDPLFQAALDKCTSLLPPAGPTEPPSTDDLEASREFAVCLREHGIAEFPDPEPGANQVLWVASAGDGRVPEEPVRVMNGIVVLDLADPKIAAAFDACRGLLPNNDD